MKKLTALLIVLAFTMLLTTSAFAEIKKVPKTLCFNSPGGFFSLGFKKSTKIKGYNIKGSKFYYAIHGEWNNFYPVTGTAYITEDEDPELLKGSFSGQLEMDFRSFYFEIDTATEIGTFYTTTTSGAMTIDDCATGAYLDRLPQEE